jgi:hypothetical protein
MESWSHIMRKKTSAEHAAEIEAGAKREAALNDAKATGDAASAEAAAKKEAAHIAGKYALLGAVVMGVLTLVGGWLMKSRSPIVVNTNAPYTTPMRCEFTIEYIFENGDAWKDILAHMEPFCVRTLAGPREITQWQMLTMKCQGGEVVFAGTRVAPDVDRYKVFGTGFYTDLITSDQETLSFTWGIALRSDELERQDLHPDKKVNLNVTQYGAGKPLKFTGLATLGRAGWIDTTIDLTYRYMDEDVFVARARVGDRSVFSPADIPTHSTP